MLHYLIDGYNLLFALPQMPQGTWLEKRLGLMLWLSQTRPQGRNLATIVFDNRQGWGDEEQHQDVTVVYTSGETADDWIASKVRSTKNPRILVVVSNDKGIQKMIRGTGARWMSAHYFVASTQKPQTPAPPPEMPTGDKDKITDELRKRWLAD